MLIENYKMKCPMMENSNVVDRVGTIVGANIKSIPFSGNLTTLGIFLHVKVDDDQYDLVFPLYDDVIRRDDEGMPYMRLSVDIPFKKAKRMYKRMKDAVNPKKECEEIHIREYLNMPSVFKAVGVNEWVELIGKEITISTISLANPDDTDPIWMYIKTATESDDGTHFNVKLMISNPMYYGITSADTELVNFVENVARRNELHVFTEENCSCNI